MERGQSFFLNLYQSWQIYFFFSQILFSKLWRDNIFWLKIRACLALAALELQKAKLVLAQFLKWSLWIMLNKSSVPWSQDVCMCACAQLCLTLCYPMKCSSHLPIGFSRQGYWSGLPFPPPGMSRWVKSSFLRKLCQINVELIWIYLYDGCELKSYLWFLLKVLKAGKVRIHQSPFFYSWLEFPFSDSEISSANFFFPFFFNKEEETLIYGDCISFVAFSITLSRAWIF